MQEKHKWSVAVAGCQFRKAATAGDTKVHFGGVTVET
jgi:hypothetical protein